MSGRADDTDPESQSFLRSMVSPERALGGHRELGSTPLARQLGLADEQMGGHCCQGIWYGWPLEVECPRCGNRGG